MSHDFILECIRLIDGNVHKRIMRKINDFLKYMILYANEDFHCVIKSVFNLAQEDDLLKERFSKGGDVFIYNTVIIYSDTIIDNIYRELGQTPSE